MLLAGILILTAVVKIVSPVPSETVIWTVAERIRSPLEVLVWSLSAVEFGAAYLVGIRYRAAWFLWALVVFAVSSATVHAALILAGSEHKCGCLGNVSSSSTALLAVALGLLTAGYIRCERAEPHGT